MALSAAMVWEVRTTGADTNGGGFKAGASGTDRSQQNTAHATLTTLSVVGAVTTDIVVSVADYTVVAADVGNLYQNTGGTSTAGFYEIVSVNTGTNTWTMDRAVGTVGQTCTGKMGGAVATLGIVNSNAVAGNTCYIKKTATYSVAAQITHNTAWTDFTIEGYNTTRGDGSFANAPVLQASAAIALIYSTTLIGNCKVKWIVFDGNSNATSCVQVVGGASGRVVFYGCEAKNALDHGFAGGGLSCVFCSSHDNGDNGFGSGTYLQVQTNCYCCVAYNNGLIGFAGYAAGFSFCIAYDNAQGFAYDRDDANAGLGPCNCVAYSNTGDGFGMSGSHGHKTWPVSCIAYGNGGYGFGTSIETVHNCAGGSNTSGNVKESTTLQIAFQALTADPFVDAVGGNFALNNTAGGGAACRAAGFPGAFPGGLTTGYLDIGAVQHQDAGGAAVEYVPGRRMVGWTYAR